MRLIPTILTAAIALAAVAPASVFAQGFKVVSTLPNDGAGPAQSLQIDSDARRLYAGRQGGVDVYDIDAGTKVGTVAVDGNVGGITLAPDIGRAYAL